MVSKPVRRWVGLTLLLAWFGGCSAAKPPGYQNAQGFRFTPPPGWVERARDDALPQNAGHRPPDVPLPRLGRSGNSERLLVRYDRLTAGHLAWLRITVADPPSTQSLPTVVASYSPGAGWKRSGEVESLEVSGHPAARVAFAGRWNKQDYLCETVAVRSGEQVYFLSASFPAADAEAREQVRQAVDHAGWAESAG
jgi:hypothetical protein